MFIKKLYNDLDTLVDEAMAGSRLIADDAEKYSRVLPNSRITVRRDKYKKPKGLVKLVGGGGAGHEGPPGSFIRPGGFDAMTTGDIFAAPSARQLFRMIQEITAAMPRIHTEEGMARKRPPPRFVKNAGFMQAMTVLSVRS